MKQSLALLLTATFVVGPLLLPSDDASTELSTATLLGVDGHQEAVQPSRRIARQQADNQPEAQPSNNQPPVEGEPPAERVSSPAAQADFPAIAVTADGATWVGYLEWNRGETDRVVVRRKPSGGTWSEPIELADGCFEHYIPALAPRGNQVLAVWSGHNDNGFDLYSAQITTNGQVSTVRQLTDAQYSDMNVRCASDAEGNVTVVWQTFRDQQSDIYVCRLTDNTWSEALRVSPSEASDWEPAVAIDSTGRAWISWDSYEHGNYDVYLRSFDGHQLGDVIPITTEPSAQFHSTVAVDSMDRVWVAWDDAGINWGKDYSRSSAAEGSRGLHYSRALGIRVVDAGRVRTPAADVPIISPGQERSYAQLPHLATDSSGTLWMVFRHWTIKKPHEMFDFYATRLTSGGWTQPFLLANSSGRNTQHAGLARGADGSLRVVYSSDGRAPDVKAEDAYRALPYVVYMASLPRGTEAAVALNEVDLPAPERAPPRRPRHTHTVGDKTYTLLFGDCHRHTDVRGHSGVDGSALDTYRYALDAAQLDFLGLGDHNQVTGGQWPDALRDYQWWYEQKFVDLFTHQPRFMGIYSYEHSLSTPAGHRNMLHLKRGAPMRVAQRLGGRLQNPDNQPPNLWKWVNENVLSQPGQKIVIVPHTFAAGPLANWDWPNADFDCLLEIYQGARGSYEAWRLPTGEKRGPTQTDDPGHFARDALERKNIYGFVSFSDHGSTHNSWAGVWVEQPTRESLFEAMLAKRTFGASDEIVMRISAEDASSSPTREIPVGSHLVSSAASPPRIKIDVEAPDTILRVDIIKNGQYIYTTPPNARRFKATFHDRDVAKGDAYYYVRVIQRDPENPSGDPEIAWASPFFVAYE